MAVRRTLHRAIPCAALVLLLVSFGGAAIAQAPASTQAPATPVQDAPADKPKPDAPPPAPEGFAFHAQTTFVYQGHDSITSPYEGPNSLKGVANGRETWDVTFYAGISPWKGAELWINPEVDQGFGLSNTLGAAGFFSGEAYKVGAADPYLRLQRFFIRQTIDLAGEKETVDPDQNVLGGSRSKNRVVLTFGKMSVGDIFDTNKYAHDPRGDFLNWTLLDAGSFDYAADAWGYSAGGAAEWYQGRWTLRGGAYLLSNVPNSTKIDTRFDQFQLIGEVEERHQWFGKDGKLKITGFLSRGRMGKLDDAVAFAAANGGAPDPANVRRYASRPGVSLNLEQSVADDLGVFARAGWADGTYETYEFTDADTSFSAGAALQGKRWGRPDDTVALAGVVNEASGSRERYLAAGGLGILIGDGRLPHPGSERILESYYDATVVKGLHLALDYQYAQNPAYNRDRGPVSVLAMRVHGQF